MSEDALQAMNMYDDEAYKALEDEAKIDNRVGKHTAIVTKVVHDKWPSGDDRTKVDVVLQTAQSAKADLTLSVPPTPAQVVAEKSTWDAKKKKAIANTVALNRQLAQHYNKTRTQIREGDTFRVETVKTRRDAEGKGGFIRVIAFLPRETADNGAAPPAGGGPGF